MMLAKWHLVNIWWTKRCQSLGELVCQLPSISAPVLSPHGEWGILQCFHYQDSIVTQIQRVAPADDEQKLPIQLECFSRWSIHGMPYNINYNLQVFSNQQYREVAQWHEGSMVKLVPTEKNTKKVAKICKNIKPSDRSANKVAKPQQKHTPRPQPKQPHLFVVTIQFSTCCITNEGYGCHGWIVRDWQMTWVHHSR